MRVRTLTLVVALVLTAAPADAEPLDPVAVAKAVTSDTVRVVASIDGPPTGTILSLCESHTDPEPNGTLVGTIKDDCFLPLGSWCEAFIVTVNPDHTPPKVNANPNWMCIEDTIEELLGSTAVRPPLPVPFEV